MSIYLSIIIPAYNESDRLPETLALVKDYLDQQTFSSEVLVVDDGSKDDTVALVKKMIPRFSQLRLIENTVNKGKGGVVKQGMLDAKGEYRLFMDADHSTPITEVGKLLAEVAKYPVVIGSRYLHPESIKIKQPLQRRILSRAANLVIQSLLLPGIRDTQCGFKLFSAEATQRIFPLQTMTGWSFDFEILVIAHQLGFTIKEVPVDWFDAKQSKLRASRAALHSLRDVKTIRQKRKKGQYK